MYLWDFIKKNSIFFIVWNESLFFQREPPDMRMGQMGMGGKCGVGYCYCYCWVLWPSSFLCVFISFSTKSMTSWVALFYLLLTWRELLWQFLCLVTGSNHITGNTTKTACEAVYMWKLSKQKTWLKLLSDPYVNKKYALIKKVVQCVPTCPWSQAVISVMSFIILTTRSGVSGHVQKSENTME